MGDSDGGQVPGGAPRLMFYNDGRHPLIYQFEPPMLVEELELAVDELVQDRGYVHHRGFRS